MTDDDLYLLIGQLQRHEGVRLKPYTDTVGKLTIGVGRNLTDRGLSHDEIDLLLANDIEQAQRDCERTFAWFAELDSVRQAALVNICFNLGLTRLLTFQHALGAMALGDYDLAADEFWDSRWSRQVGNRALELTEQIRTGVWGT